MIRIFKYFVREYFNTEIILAIIILLFLIIVAITTKWLSIDDDQKRNKLEKLNDAFCMPSISSPSVKLERSVKSQPEEDQPKEEEDQPTFCSRSFIFGTNGTGEDVFYQTFIKLLNYIVPSLIIIIITVIFGSLFGVLEGYYTTKFFSRVFSLIPDSLSVFPQLLLLVLVCNITNPSLLVLALIFALSESVRLGKSITNKINILAQEDFIASSKEIGLPDWIIIVKHILWYNCRNILIIHSLFAISGFIMIETCLGYLQMAGNLNSWGDMIQSGVNNYTFSPWLLTYPTLVILTLCFSIFLLCDGLLKKQSQQ